MKNIPYELIARYLAGECNDDEIQQVQEWSQEHPDEMDEFVRIWEQIPSEEFTLDVEMALLNVNTRINSNKRKNKSKSLFFLIGGIAAAAIAAIFVLVNIIGVEQQNDLPNGNIAEALLTLDTEKNETLEYTLPDNSKVWLNKSSSIKYPEKFAGNIREIYLEGEAFFDIAPDKDRPFIIHANNTQTRVVGTSFGIRAIKDAEEVIVTVSTGIINFSTEGKSEHIELKKGEQGICKPEQKELEKNTNPDPNSLAWKTKVLVFKESSLKDVARIIENAYQTSVDVDDSVSGLQITSTFEQLSLEEILEIIEITLQIRAESTDSGILLTAK